MSNKKETFKQFLQANLSYHDYTHLHEYLSNSVHLTTKLINDPRRGETKDLLIIEMLLQKWNPSLNRQYLREEFQFCLQETQTEVIR